MSTKKRKKVVSPETPVEKKEKKPKFKLVSYTVKAVIPTGMYANIQPEVTVQAETIELAERAVMPHIEALFAKYRTEGPQAPQTPRPVTTQVPVAAQKGTYEQVSKSGEEMLKNIKNSQQNGTDRSMDGIQGPTATPTPNVILTPTTNTGPTPAIVLPAPFNKAKSAIESCTSHDALKLISDQIEKSVKLIDSEKVELKKLVTIKTNDITIAQQK